MLIWKEWHEQRWKLGFGCIILGALVVIGLHARIIDDQTMMIWACFLGTTLLPVLSSTGLIPAERAEGSLEGLLALPVTPRQVLAVKTAAGVVLCIVPLVVAACLSLFVAGGREASSSSIVDLYGRSIVSSVSLFIWMLALTVRLPSETRAGMLSVGLVVLWFLAALGLLFVTDRFREVSRAALAVSAFSPLSVLWSPPAEGFVAPPILAAVTAQGIVAILLWLWASTQLVGTTRDQD